MRKGYDSVDDLQRTQPEQLAAERDGALVRAELAQRLLPVQPLDELGGRRRGREDRARSLPEHDLGGLAAELALEPKRHRACEPGIEQAVRRLAPVCECAPDLLVGVLELVLVDLVDAEARPPGLAVQQ